VEVRGHDTYPQELAAIGMLSFISGQCRLERYVWLCL
jgi:hypothetical protein